MKPLRIRDAHTHLWSSLPPYPDLVPAPRGGDAIDLITAMDEAGVHVAAVVTPGAMGWDNSATLAVSRAHRDRFVPVGRVNIQDPSAVHSLADDIAHGLRGIRVSPVNDLLAGGLLGEAAEHVWCKMAEGDLPVAVHAHSDQLKHVSALAEAHPELTLLLDHMGRPDVTAGVSDARFQAVLSLAEHENVAVKTPNAPFFSQAGSPFGDLAPFIAAALHHFGARRLLWGSDWPGSVVTTDYRSTLQPTLAVLEERTESESRLVLGGNFERLFRLSS